MKFIKLLASCFIERATSPHHYPTTTTSTTPRLMSTCWPVLWLQPCLVPHTGAAATGGPLPQQGICEMHCMERRGVNVNGMMLLPIMIMLMIIMLMMLMITLTPHRPAVDESAAAVARNPDENLTRTERQHLAHVCQHAETHSGCFFCSFFYFFILPRSLALVLSLLTLSRPFILNELEV